MSEGVDSVVEPAASGPEDSSIGTLLSQLVDDGENFVRAEIRLYRAQAIARLVEARTAVAMIAVAAVILLASAIALLVGLIFILAPYLGRVGAVAVVIGLALALAWILVRVALAKLRKATDPDASPAEPDLGGGR
ncbi:phage holin family protein [Sphingomonas sanxanigenens]|uniref:phage holin family protein n=1 Tax=Sphingomonas sanxanigenens TaxID=397260 RepID=UPI0013015FB1|nr:phage holin family protein [Sphingomonas sanxanigenens]